MKIRQYYLACLSHASYMITGELRDKVGAAIHLGSRAEAEFDHVAMKDGDRVEFGDVRPGARCVASWGAW